MIKTLHIMADTLATEFTNWNSSAGLVEEADVENSAGDVCTQEEFHSILVREKARADRNGHGFSLVTVNMANHQNAPLIKEDFKQRIRLTDEIGWFDQNILGVFLYNTPALGAWQFVNKRNTKHDVLLTCDCSVYSYPNEWCNF